MMIGTMESPCSSKSDTVSVFWLALFTIAFDSCSMEENMLTVTQKDLEPIKIDITKILP